MDRLVVCLGQASYSIMKVMSHARRAPSNHETSPSVSVRVTVTVTKPLPAGRQAFRLGSNGYVPAHRSACVSARRRELLRTMNVAD